MKIAATAAEEDLPDIATLLKEGSFQQRMEAARKQRERVLAMRAAEAGDQSDLVAVHKPWGKQGWETPSQRRLVDPSVAKVVFPVLNDEGDTDTRTASLPALAAASEGPALQAEGAKRRGFMIARSSWGFALGLGLGLAVATAIPYLRSRNAPPEAVLLPAPAPTANAGAPSTAEVSAAVVVSPTVEVSSADEASSAVESAARSDPPQDTSPAVIVPGEEAVAQAVAPAFGAPAAEDSLPALDVAAGPILQGLSDWSPPSSVGAAPYVGERMFAPPASDQPFAARFTPLMPVVSRTPDLPVADQVPPPFASAVVVPDYSAASIHILLSKGVNPGDATPLSAKLGGAGFRVTETAETGVAIRETNVRYYHPADADAAQALAAQLDVTARDFSGTSPAPPQGMIEVWVKGPKSDKAPATEVKKVKAKTKKKKPAAPVVDPTVSEAQELQALRDRLLKQLQAGASP